MTLKMVNIINEHIIKKFIRKSSEINKEINRGYSRSIRSLSHSNPFKFTLNVQMINYRKYKHRKMLRLLQSTAILE